MDKIKVESMKSLNDIDVSVVKMNINRKYRNYPDNINVEHEVSIQNGNTVEEYFIKIGARCFSKEYIDDTEYTEDTSDIDRREEIANYEILFFIESKFTEKYLNKLERNIKNKNEYICEILNSTIIAAYPHMKKYLSFIANTLEINDTLEVMDFIQTADNIKHGIKE